MRFDPYHQWLGIRDPARPPSHYRLLGVDLFESDPDVILTAADRQMAHLRTFQHGQHVELSQQLLNEVAAAKVCLLDPDKKARYDAILRAALAPEAPPARPLALASARSDHAGHDRRTVGRRLGAATAWAECPGQATASARRTGVFCLGCSVAGRLRAPAMAAQLATGQDTAGSDAVHCANCARSACAWRVGRIQRHANRPDANRPDARRRDSARRCGRDGDAHGARGTIANPRSGGDTRGSSAAGLGAGEAAGRAARVLGVRSAGLIFRGSVAPRRRGRADPVGVARTGQNCTGPDRAGPGAVAAFPDAAVLAGGG